MDSPADPAVWTMLFSRMVASRPPAFDHSRKSVREITATGIDALTVRPTLRTRLSDEAPNTMPSRVPRIMARGVHSRMVASCGTWDWKPVPEPGAGQASLDICRDT